jgi:hypothetical protein
MTVKVEQADPFYKIGRFKPNYASAFTYGGRRFHVHRPIVNRKKLDVDWQFSCDGIPLTVLGGRTKADAIELFLEKAEMLGSMFGVELKETMELNAYDD